jgi:hypothetical protein
MGLVYADIELINGEDLGLPVVGIWTIAVASCREEKAQLANGLIVECDVVAPAEFRFKNRRSFHAVLWYYQAIQSLYWCYSFGGYGCSYPPLRQELVVNPDHPYFAQMKMK